MTKEELEAMSDADKDTFFRKRLLDDYDRLIHWYEEAIPRAGQNFGMWVSPMDGKLILAALKTARNAANAETTAGDGT